VNKPADASEAEITTTEPAASEEGPAAEAAEANAEVKEEAVEQTVAQEEAGDGGETAGETSEEERPVTATLRRPSGINCRI
jgi:hypothetical protein